MRLGWRCTTTMATPRQKYHENEHQRPQSFAAFFRRDPELLPTYLLHLPNQDQKQDGTLYGYQQSVMIAILLDVSNAMFQSPLYSAVIFYIEVYF